MLIVSGYLRQAYAQDFPLSLSASLSFEQSYSGIEGDSASAAEVFALISSLSGIPLRQDLAVTGSRNARSIHPSRKDEELSPASLQTSSGIDVISCLPSVARHGQRFATGLNSHASLAACSACPPSARRRLRSP